MENGIVNVANALADDFEFHVACLSHAGRMAARLVRSQQVHELGKGPGFSFQVARRLGRLTGSVQADIVHTHNLGPLIYASIARMLGPRVTILHGEHSQFSGEDLRIRRLLQRRLLYRAATIVHTVSQHQAAELLTHPVGLSKDKLRAVVNGVDADRFIPCSSQQARTSLGIPHDAFTIGIVGRFGPHKRHHVLIEAFEQILVRRPNVHLLMVGAGGPEEPSVLARCASSPASASIHLIGYTAQPDLLYPAMNLLAVPSVNEGLSNAILEAMACGVPALSHRACGSSEAITSERDGVIADLATSSSVAIQLERLIAEPEKLAAMGVRARQTAVDRFSLQSMASQYAALYRSLIRA
jgi:glycosyltransferase involved in cell wall biosynthesis